MRRHRRGHGITLALALGAVAVGAAAAAPVAAQEPAPTAGLFGLWPQKAHDLPPGSDVIAVVPIDGSTEETLRVAVRFAQPFEASDRYRASVVVGDPSSNAQLRVSYLAGFGTSSGIVEAKTDGKWTEVAPGVIGGSPSDGVLEFDIPRGLLAGAGDPSAADPPALWLETDVPVDNGSRLAQSNYFAFTAFLPDALESGPTTAAGLPPTIAGSSWGSVEAYATSTPFLLQPALKAPSLAIANSGLLITTDLAVPTAVDGQTATSAQDRIHVLPADLAGGSPGYIQIDRIAGTIDLHRSDGMLVVTGDKSWIGDGLDPADPGAAGTVTVDLPAVAKVFGLPENPEQLAVSADRVIELADLRTIVATGTGATASVIGEFTAPPQSEAPATASTTGATSSSDGGDSALAKPVLAGAVALLLLVVLAVVAFVVVRRRRRSEHDGSFGGPPPSRGASSRRDRGGHDDRASGASPDEVIAALERQFAEFDLPASGSGDTDGVDKPSLS